ncbi:hypothetical protein [Niallia sp. NCCP-28]|uniref:hypothetical protein n=1 Tax=Niallia sp. NCCP-28 TaxID=2934712 RepID=UPI00207E8C34|nr:hypothetical protein [Niallia sp. NCCP-28]GKU82574.1 hypothetical protein NCCP28_19700 [Niallia sp. NCCP-28]
MKAKIILLGGLITATLLGIFGQDIAYWFENIVNIDALYNLTIITVLSISIYLITILLAYVFFKKINKQIFYSYIAIIVLIGLLTTLWSIFVLAMWWG